MATCKGADIVNSTLQIQDILHWGKDWKHSIGNILFWFFLLVVMVDPTNNLFHAKNIVFIVLCGYNIIVFKPDFSKLPYILILIISISVPWIFSQMSMTYIDPDEALAVFKSISPSILLLWIREYNIVRLSKAPVIICSVIMFIIFTIVLIYPQLEYPFYQVMESLDEPIFVAWRQFLGITILGMYLPSCVSFVFVIAFYMYCLFNGEYRTKKRIFYLIIICTYMAFMSGTRSSMLVSFYLLCLAGYVSLNNQRYKNIIMCILFIIGILFVMLILALILETDEASNSVKYGHIISYKELFDAHPEYMIFGQGPGNRFFSEGFNRIVVKTEWSYLELLRCYGIMGLGVVYVFWHPLFEIYKSSKDQFSKCVCGAYLAYLFIAGTNPLMLSSTGMAVLLMAYSYIEMIKKEQPTKSIPI